jgi:hypothetical protein
MGDGPGRDELMGRLPGGSVLVVGGISFDTGAGIR